MVYGEKYMSNDTVGIGIIGLRNIGMNHAKLAAADQGCRLVVVADTDPDRVAEGSRLGDDVRAYSNAEDLLGDDRLDGVVLAVPNHLHAPLTVVALRAGKHVLVEKPMAMTAAEADEMIQARDASGRVLMSA